MRRGQHSDQDWERLALDNPYFAVLTEEQYLPKQLDDATRAQFFASGETHTAQMLNLIHDHVDPAFVPKRALDFGCGVGRVTIPLAARCETVVGVDVSETMLREAAARCAELDITNVSLIHDHGELAGIEGSFNLIHAYLVFQHIPVARGLDITARLIDLLEEGGIGVLHYTYYRAAPGWRKLGYWARLNIPGVHAVLNSLKGRSWSAPLMQANRYPLNNLFHLLQTHGCSSVYITFTDFPGSDGITVVFQKYARS